MSDRILVTGANGFVGEALCRRLLDSGFLVRSAVRNEASLQEPVTSSLKDCEWVVLHDASSEDEIKHIVDGSRTIVHLAARVHVMAETASHPQSEFHRINTNWTERLARAAAALGVQRFVYLSSIKVNGEQSVVPFTEQDSPNPLDAYGVSKWKAEQVLNKVSVETGMETVVIRSPLVYGPNVRGNFLQLLKVLSRGIPLPLAGIHNRRSFIYRDNLIDALMHCMAHQRSAGHTYLVSDGEDLSTPELLRRLGKALGLTVRLWSLPTPLLRLMGRVAGKQPTVDRLLESLQVDSSRISRELSWRPPCTVDQGFAETAAWFCAHSPG